MIFDNNPQLTDDTAACMVWSEAINVILLTQAKWRTFTDRPIPPATSSEVMFALSCDSREAVDAMNEAAAKNGGTLSSTPPARFRTPTIPGRRSREHGAVAIALNSMTKFVFSRTLKDVTWRNSRLLREIDPREIETMKGQPGKAMIIFGSGSIVSQLTQHGLIDEYQFVVCPIFLGSGQPLLSGVSKRLRLDLLEAKPLPSGDVMLTAERQHLIWGLNMAAIALLINGIGCHISLAGCRRLDVAHYSPQSYFAR